MEAIVTGIAVIASTVREVVVIFIPKTVASIIMIVCGGKAIETVVFLRKKAVSSDMPTEESKVYLWCRLFGFLFPFCGSSFRIHLVLLENVSSRVSAASLTRGFM